MKLEFQNRWLRIVIEFLPAGPVIRRYRAAPARLEGEMRRMLQREIARQMRRSTSEGAT